MAGLALLPGTANRPLAEAVARAARVALLELGVERFPDGELHVLIDGSVRGHDVFILQPTSPPFETHFLELLLSADACRRAGAARVTAVIPYFGYARQDRRATGREAVGARVVADALASASIDRVVAVDLHSTALEGFFGFPVEHLTAVPLLARRAADHAREAVVVAPDLGAARLADNYARLLDLPTAIVHKTRISGADVVTRGVTGEVRGRTPLIVDDMISTGGTIAAAAAALREAGARSPGLVIATHALLVGDAETRLRGLELGGLIVTDSTDVPRTSSLSLEVVSVAPLLADAVLRLHEGRSLADLLAHH
jgi:ribose-phosphate pyrophosphokinase